MTMGLSRATILAVPLAVYASSLVLADLVLADDVPPAYVDQASDLVQLDNGVVLDGQDLETQDGYTSGFRLTAGFSPLGLLDLGAEFSYRESDEVPAHLGGRSLILDTTSLGGSLVAGLRFGRLGLYAKSGFAGWEGHPIIEDASARLDTGGTTRVRGFGARLQINRLVSRLEFEEFDAPSMSHLNLVTASLHLPF